MNYNNLVSVIICTRNRSEVLEEVLKALRDQSLSPKYWELVVVDNGSIDNTPTVLERHESNFPRKKFLTENRLGSNFARNKGWSHATGSLMAFLDDDAIPHPQWIERILQRYENLNTNQACLGGKVLLQLLVKSPRWYGPFLENYLSFTHLGNNPTYVQGKSLCSANLVIPKSILEMFTGFDERINRTTETLMSNDETLTVLKMELKGIQFFYDPAIKVYHQIGSERLTQGYFRKRAHRQGRSDAQMEFILEGRKSLWTKIIWPSLYHLYQNPSLLWMAFRPCRGPRKFNRALQGQLFLGRILGGLLNYVRPFSEISVDRA